MKPKAAETFLGESTAELSLLGLLTGPKRHGSILVAAALLLASWLGTNAIWGITSTTDTIVSALERRLFPLEWWLAAITMTLVAVVVTTLRWQQGHLRTLAIILVAYLGGVLLSRIVTVSVPLPDGSTPPVATDALWWTVRRLFLLLTAVPMFAALLVLPHWRFSDFPFRFGDWTVKTRLFEKTETLNTWSRQFVGWLLLAALPLALLMQALVDFKPILSGAIWPFLPPLTILSLLNAFSEELLFRGLLQPVLVRYLGVGIGIWTQAVFFGIHHWGSSPSIIAGFPTAIVTAFLGLVWGKSTHETGGLGWAIGIHMAVDLAFFSAQFVPTN